jgi:hypothetical protein
MRLLHTCLLSLVCALVTGSVLAAPIYKWTDAEGRIHYEDTRPPEGEVKVIAPPEVYRGEPATSAAPDAQPGTQAATSGTTQGEAGERERKCAESREALTQGQAAERMYTLDAQGNRTYLTAAEIEAHVAKLQEAVESWCGTP